MKMQFNLFLVIAMIATVFAGSSVYAGEGVLKRGATVAKPAKADVSLTRSAKKPAVKVMDLPKEPFIYIIETKMGAAELHTQLEMMGYKSVPLDVCWRDTPERAMTKEVVDALMSDHRYRIPNYANMESPIDPAVPVIWHSFEYHPEVMAARKLDPYTRQPKNRALATQNPGGVERWNPQKCTTGESEYQRALRLQKERNSIVSPGLPSIDDDHFPEAHFPEPFLPGEGVWVINKN